jgi:hypothetical protein
MMAAPTSERSSKLSSSYSNAKKKEVNYLGTPTSSSGNRLPKAKLPSPPPKRAGTPFKILETPNRVIQRNATNDWLQKLDVREPIRAKEPESHEQKEPTEQSTMVEAMRLQDSDSYTEEEVGAYVCTDKTTTEDDMKSKQPLSQASSTNTMPPSTETWALRQQELT